MTADRELRPVGRFDWEGVVRRARLGSVIPARKGKGGKVTKGGMSGTLFTGIALGWSSYANPDGSRVKPGDATVAIDLETSIAAVRAVRQALLALGLMQQVGSRQKGFGIEYRLTMPSDLLDRVDVLTPAQHKLAANRLRDSARGKPTPGWSSGLPEVGVPVDYPQSEAPLVLGGPVGHPADPIKPTPGWSSGTTESEFGWSSGTSLGGPVDTHTYQGPSKGTTGHSLEEVRSKAEGPPAQAAAEDQISGEAQPRAVAVAPPPAAALTVTDATVEIRPAPAPQPSQPATTCPRHRLPIPAGEPRPDGKPRCPLCRVGAPETSASPSPQSDEGTDAA